MLGGMEITPMPALTAMQQVQVQVPPDAQTGAQIEALVGGQRIMVQIPEGVAPGDVITVQIPQMPAAAPDTLAALPARGGHPAVPSDASLDDRLKASGGSFTLTSDAAKGFTLTSENGDVIAVIKVGSSNDQPVTIVLPDGTIAVKLQPVANPRGGWVAKVLKGDAGAALGETTAHQGLGCTDFTWDLRTTGGKREVVFSLVPPTRLWVLPFVLGTFCLGAICVECMKSGPSFYIKKGSERVGVVTDVRNCCDPLRGITKYTSSDPAALRGCMNLAAFQCYWLKFTR
jgi:hypothetical protein